MRKMKWWNGFMCRVPVFLAAVVLVGAGCAGGIRSVAHIDSQPSGAMVTVNYVERGRTPIDIPILWYWHYQIELEKEGYDKIVKDERFYAPWYAAIPPFDLIVEAIPIPIRNTYRRSYTLTPKESE